MAVASSGMTARTASATSSIASGRQARLLGVDEPAALGAGLEHEVPAADRVGQQVLAERGQGRRGSDRRSREAHARHPRSDLARSTALGHAASSRARPRPPSADRLGRQPGPCRCPRLNTGPSRRRRSSPARAISAKIRGTAQRAALDDGAPRPSGRTRTRLPAIPPPVTCAAACTPPGRRSRPARAGRVDDRGLEQLVGRASAPPRARPGRSSERPARSSRTWRARL